MSTPPGFVELPHRDGTCARVNVDLLAVYADDESSGGCVFRVVGVEGYLTTALTAEEMDQKINEVRDYG